MRHDSIIYNWTKDIVCTEPETCHKRIRFGLESKLGISIHSRNNKQSVAITTTHLDHNHLVILEFYTKAELPNKLHEMELTVLPIIPNYDMVESKLLETLDEENSAFEKVISWVRRRNLSEF